ncbi:MAG: hypothetical protein E6Q66_10530 [Pedobacter sp.]|nr:MAG: hypothetical protein E6Q66_10530 [Pedobacter sp.]
MTIENTLKQFALSFGREGVDNGNIKIKAHPITISEPQLKTELKEFYSLSNFDELIIGGELFMEIFPIEKLSKAQDGWRFITNPRDKSISEDTDHWNKDWIVFGDRNGDAIFCKQDINNAPVYGSIQKEKFLLLANSLNAFFQILTESMMMEKNIFEFNTQTDDFILKADFINAVQTIVNKYSESNKSNDFIEFFFG